MIATVVATGFFAALGAAAAPSEKAPDILNPPPGPCAGAMAGADYVSGTGAEGHPVPPAELEGESKPPLPPEIVVPAGPSGAYATLDHKTLRQLVTPQSCGH